MAKVIKFFKILIGGQAHSRPNVPLPPAILNQIENVKKVWHNEQYVDFGIERLIRIFLVLSLFLFPGLYIKQLSGTRSVVRRKLAVDLFVLFKLFLPFFTIYFSWFGNPYVLVLNCYLMTETILYLASLVFLSSEIAKPVSYKRSLVAAVINYIELCLCYAVIYNYCHLHIPGFFNSDVGRLKVVYFSFISAATIGYGDLAVNNAIGYLLVISQTLVFLLFIVIFLNFFAGKLHDPGSFQPRPKGHGKGQ